MRIAVLGLGRMGQAVATRLLDRNYDVVVWNRTPGKAGDLTTRGAQEAASLSEAVSDVDVVMTFLTADAAVRQVYLEDNGVVDHAGTETILIDMSTVSPDTSRTVERASSPGQFIDAPILGGPEVTAEGKAKLLVGGDERTVKALDKLWNDISSGYIYCGSNGSATTLKLLSNLMLVGGTMLMAEAVATAQANGIGTDVIRRVIGESPAVAPGVRVRFEDVLSGSHEGWWTIQLAEKDIQLALQLATGHDLTLTLGSAAERFLHDTDRAGYGAKDLGAVVESVRRQTAKV